MLNDDILLEILDILRDTSPRSLIDVALTSSSLYDLSQSFIYRTVSFTFNRDRRDINGRLIRRLLTQSTLSAKVREVEIRWAPNANLQPGEGSKEDLELLGRALPRMTGLSAFIWDAQYPILSWLVDILKSDFPRCKIYARHPPSQESARTLPRLHNLASLFSLNVTLQPGQYSACRELERILNSSKLTDLSMDTSFCYLSETQPVREPLQLRSLEVYSCLNDSWRPAIMWPMLQRLSTDSVSWLPEVAPQLTNLKSLQLNVQGSDNKIFVIDFLRSCERLEVLDITGDTAHVLFTRRSLWRHLGKTLVKLRFYPDYVIDQVFGVGDVEMIAIECPKLRSLGLRIDGHKARCMSLLNRIAKAFWFIVHFEFKFPDSHTFTSMKGVSELWAQMWQDIQTSRSGKSHDTTLPRLRSLDTVGATQLRIKADLVAREDEASNGVAIVTCAELEALKSKLSSARPLWTREQERILKAVTQAAENGTRIIIPATRASEMVRPPAFWDRLDENRFYHRR